jgi:AmmeMemoRadiSam system protein B/AmmeMemoRadiSam system protein A
MAGIHRSPYAGSWYPGDEGELRPLVEAALESSRRRTGSYLLPNPIAFVVPHAGLMYSGTVACAAYRYVQARQPRRVVLLGFSHHGGLGGVAIPDTEAFTTPLGDTRIDHEAVAFLRSHAQFRLIEEERVCDHSVEIQLPLLQVAAPEARLVPLYVGSMPVTEQYAAARALAELTDGETLFLASSDLTHFGRAFGYQPFPADRQAEARLAELDRIVMEDAGSLDAPMFLEGLQQSGATVCGRAPIALLLRTLGMLRTEEIFQSTLDYQTSGELTGDFTDSVSYGALGYFPASSFKLSPDDAEQLLATARGALVRFLHSGVWGAIAAGIGQPALMRRAGVFVTLREQGRLRGCVGTPVGGAPLAQTVQRMVLSAATEDSRFAPIEPGFGGKLDIDISLLSPMKRIRSRESYRLHEHGAILESGDCRSLLLPQVSLNRGWTANQFWDALARKAELPATVYDDPRTRLHVFRAQIIQ